MNVERRFSPQRVSLNLLNHTQRSTFDELAQSGFGLLFIRNTGTGQVAVCSSGNELATIDESGLLIKSPAIDLRR